MTLEKIIWANNKIYDHQTLLNRMKFIESKMHGLMPLCDKEKQELIAYAHRLEIPSYEVISLRNTIRIQKEIMQSRKIYMRMEQIKNSFRTIENKQKKIKHWLSSLNLPIQAVIKIINNMPEYKSLSSENLAQIKEITECIKESNIEILKRSMEFEHQLENYLKSLKINFRTEVDIKSDKDYAVTPDILFDKPIILELNGVDHVIRWLDAKNYLLTDTPFIVKSLKKQSEKYNDVFGMGAFVFHYGYDKSVDIPNVLILDGSMLDLIN